MLIVPFLLGLAHEATAVDGAIEINQARALAGGVTAGDMPGFPVEINGGGHFILTSGLDLRGQANPESLNAITVAAPGASIDMNGFGIIGPTLCTGIPVTSCSPTGTGIGILFGPGAGSVTDGAISGMGSRGIDMRASSVGLVRRVGVFHSGENAVTLPASALADHVSTSANGGVGIQLGGGGAVLNSSAFNNGGDGIQVGDGSHVKDSISSNNGGSGISLGAAALAEKCITNVNGDAGITSVFGGIVRDSVTVANTTDGIRVGGNSTLTHNNSYSNTGDGIEAGANSTAVGNMVSGNIGYGLNIGTGSGYQANVVNSNTAGTVNGVLVIETGGNVCGGDSVCP
jgi:hypothetical protein